MAVFTSFLDTAFNANNWFNNLRDAPRDSVISHNFGGRLGGPITRRPDFFNVNYDGFQNRSADTVTDLIRKLHAREFFGSIRGVQNGNANAAVPPWTC